jgi:hypothetical protein
MGRSYRSKINRLMGLFDAKDLGYGSPNVRLNGPSQTEEC